MRRAQVTAYDVTGTHDARGVAEARRRSLVAGHHTEALGFYAVTTEERPGGLHSGEERRV
ncbi:hypothetical protein SCMC78_07960 [Streptomyces sp. CMC78]|uniref:Uncharacterized protein n=1 Tax=Streptomyces sp. CMC78 TaxID=3231512 RepID=A0AB33K5U8_9ACTN|nr:hypothetical protein [Streptomyces sp. ID01-9D]